ncbi:hypothetical protein LJC33_02360 [Eubacteriales bacterium OttesenSCG-928-N13]|nr:hypothetical protein [Eubacteriales bacterium OttesenSCG-928-N13]
MNVDIAKTQRYYNSYDKASLCGCSYCRTYHARIQAAYPDVSAYLKSLGVDVLCPHELMPLDINDTVEYYACQYVLFGSCDKDFEHQVGDVTFSVAISYPDTGLDEEHFVIQFGTAYLPIMPADGESLDADR